MVQPETPAFQFDDAALLFGLRRHIVGALVVGDVDRFRSRFLHGTLPDIFGEQGRLAGKNLKHPFVDAVLGDLDDLVGLDMGHHALHALDPARVGLDAIEDEDFGRSEVLVAVSKRAMTFSVGTLAWMLWMVLKT